MVDENSLSSVYAVVPAFNAETTIACLLDRLHAVLPAVIAIVVDDGSTDKTAERVQVGPNTLLFCHAENRGKGEALATGFKHALERGAKVVITMDSDGQHNPADIERLLLKMDKEQADIVIGNRMLNVSDMPRHRWLSNKITSALISWRTGLLIPDSQSGYRAIKRVVLQTVSVSSGYFQMESEFLIKTVLGGFKVAFETVDTIYNDSAKSAVSFVDVFRFVHVYLKSFCWFRRQKHRNTV